MKTQDMNRNAKSKLVKYGEMQKRFESFTNFNQNVFPVDDQMNRNMSKMLNKKNKREWKDNETEKKDA